MLKSRYLLLLAFLAGLLGSLVADGLVGKAEARGSSVQRDYRSLTVKPVQIWCPNKRGIREYVGTVQRSKVRGGWILFRGSDGVAFYPDSNHKWDGKSL